jgi:hypothetical protein
MIDGPHSASREISATFFHAILLNLNSGIDCLSCYDGCVDNNIGGAALPQPRRLKWQVIPRFLCILLWLVVSAIE